MLNSKPLLDNVKWTPYILCYLWNNQERWNWFWYLALERLQQYDGFGGLLSFAVVWLKEATEIDCKGSDLLHKECCPM
jgi:hypothetical protein